MKLPRGLFLLIALCTAALFAASCGGDDDSTTKPEASGPPVIESPPIIDAVDFHSENPTAQTAQTLVGGSLAAARATTAFGTGLISQPGENDWVGSGDCFFWSHSAQGCTWTYEACETSTGFSWTVTLDGNCEVSVYSDWVGLRGETNADGTSGLLQLYEENSSAVDVSVAWSRSAENDSGTWSFYDGTAAFEYLKVIMSWTESAPGTGQVTWETIGRSKWVLNYTLEGDAGTMLFYDWDGGWQLTGEITWTVAGHGSWTSYDGMGGSTTQAW